jgi:hypothetical protein
MKISHHWLRKTPESRMTFWSLRPLPPLNISSKFELEGKFANSLLLGQRLKCSTKGKGQWIEEVISLRRRLDGRSRSDRGRFWGNLEEKESLSWISSESLQDSSPNQTRAATLQFLNSSAITKMKRRINISIVIPNNFRREWLTSVAIRLNSSNQLTPSISRELSSHFQIFLRIMQYLQHNPNKLSSFFSTQEGTSLAFQSFLYRNFT